MKKKEESVEVIKHSIEIQTNITNHQQPQTTTTITQHNLIHNHQTQHHQQTNTATPNITLNQPWPCELCGERFSTRDEWSVHAKSHLEVKFL